MLCTVLVSEHKDKYSRYITVEFMLLYLSLCILFDIPLFRDTIPQLVSITRGRELVPNCLHECILFIVCKSVVGFLLKDQEKRF